MWCRKKSGLSNTPFTFERSEKALFHWRIDLAPFSIVPMNRIDLRFGASIDGRRYFLLGIVLFAVKFGIDHFLAKTVFHRTWTPIDYLAPGLNLPTLLHSGTDRVFYATMLLVALPFTYVGLVLTMQRLRSAELARSLVMLFFVPVVNVLYFIVLAMFPARRQQPAHVLPVEQIAPQTAATPLDYGHEEVARSGIAALFPEDSRASALVAIFVPLPIVAGLTLLATFVLRDYGLGLFVGMPFLLGWLSATLHGIRRRRRLGETIGVAMGSFLVSAIALIVFGIEGAGCLIMLLPLALPIVLLGALLGYACQKQGPPAKSQWRTLMALLMALPMLMGAESLDRGEAPMFAVTSVVEIDAPPAVVWKHVVSFPPLGAPREWIFRAGVAYPMHATIDGTGPGAVRRCVFSTGAFIEPIEIWEAPRLLKFTVTSNPPPMQEWSPYHIHPPHLDHFLVAQAGEFRLIELPGNRTRLEGTTWYRHNMYPAGYWRLWSDYLIHRIHLRVLEHVKRLSDGIEPAYQWSDRDIESSSH